ncbi:MAG: peptide/nickel transport system ATP-binding protein [Dinoroseobacter sp.]|jgi:peptide/nickel transport system ATP-binding protein
MSLLSVQNLSVSFPTPQGRVNVVDDLSFDLGKERLGIVGESGSGKSMTGRAILRLIRPPGQVSGSVSFEGQDLTALSERQMRAMRGSKISMIMQDPRYSLNPVMTVGTQIEEALRTHERLPRREMKARVRAMLEAVRINDPDQVARMYAHELSGGMGQRVMIAMMIIPRPRLLIADEPTSALDVSVQSDVLKLIDDLVRDNGMGLILISHDLPLVARYCDRILVMNAGRVVETCNAADLHNAQHPYTRGLLAAVPQMHETRDELPVMDRTKWARA